MQQGPARRQRLVLGRLCRQEQAHCWMRQPEGLPKKLLDKRVALQEGSTSVSSAASSSSTTSDVTVDAAAAAEVEAET